MQFWQSGALSTGLIIIGLLLFSELLASLIPSLRRVGVPLAIVAGILALFGSQQMLGAFELDIPFLESCVYHGLGILFIALSLRAPTARRGKGRDLPALSMGLAIPTIHCMQAFVALLVLLAFATNWHPGFAMLVPLGFEQGPGQALSMGAAWVELGLENGAQIGLIIAALGYGWAVVMGIPLAIIGRRRGWLSETGERTVAGKRSIEVPAAAPGGLDRLSVQLGLIALCYGLTFALCSLLSGVLASMPDIASVVWGFHFIFGAIIAIGMRTLMAKFIAPEHNPVDEELMVRVSGLTVDFVTCAALGAIQLAILQAYWLPILVLTSVCGLVTLLACLWIGSRAWVDAPFEHALLLFGMSTGTLPTGLALVRVVDPELRSPAAQSAALGSAIATPFVAPMLLALIPMTVRAYTGDWPGRGWIMLGVFFVYLIGLLAGWRYLGGLRFRGPLTKLWVPASPADTSESA